MPNCLVFSFYTINTVFKTQPEKDSTLVCVGMVFLLLFVLKPKGRRREH